MAYNRKATFAMTDSVTVVKRLSRNTVTYNRSNSENLHLKQKTNITEDMMLKRPLECNNTERKCERSAYSLSEKIQCMKNEIEELLVCLKISSSVELRTYVEKLKNKQKLIRFKKEIEEAAKKIESRVQEHYIKKGFSKGEVSKASQTMNMNTREIEKMAPRRISNLSEFMGVLNTEATVYPAFESLLNRLSSLSDFSPGINISLSRLASAGFYKPNNGENKTTKCYSCGVVYDKWESGDDPMSVHRMLNPSCPFVIEADVPEPQREATNAGNIAGISAATSLEVSARAIMYHFQDSYSGSLTRESKGCNGNILEAETLQGTCISDNMRSSSISRGNQHGQSEISSQIHQSLNQETPAALHQTSDQESPAGLGIFIDKPKYPNYAPMQARISSYKGWPSYLDQTAQQMSEAGFLFAGYNDYTRCFSCGGGLRNWEAGDDPWVEHARWFPKCSFLLQNKGDKFIDVVQRKHKEIMDQEKSVASCNGQTVSTNNTLSSESSHSRSEISHNDNLLANSTISGNSNTSICAKEVGSSPEILQTVAARSVLEMGYKDGEVMEALDKLRQFGKDESGISATDIMHVLLGDDILVQSNLPSVGASANTTCVAESSSHNDTASILDETELLLEENRQLKDQRLCKVCLDLDATIAFLPCGHIVCCKDCAPAMRKCPVCRARVKGTVKTYLA